MCSDRSHVILPDVSTNTRNMSRRSAASIVETQGSVVGAVDVGTLKLRQRLLGGVSREFR